MYKRLKLDEEESARHIEEEAKQFGERRCSRIDKLVEKHPLVRLVAQSL